MWCWGVMNSNSIKQAAAVGFPMEKAIGIWWSGAEADVTPAGDAAKGYKSLNITGVGTEAPIFDDIEQMHADGKGLADKSNIGTVLYNRALVNAYYRSEEHTSELQSLMRISYAVFCLKKKKRAKKQITDKMNIE